MKNHHSIDSIQHIDTTYQRHIEECCLLEDTSSNVYEIYAPTEKVLPFESLHTDKNIPAYMAFTTVFLIIFAFIRLRGKDILSNILTTIVKRKKAIAILDEGIYQNLICLILGLVISCASLAVFITYLSVQEIISISTLYIFAGLMLYHFLMLLIINYLGWTFNAKHLAKEFSVNLWTFNISCGLIISPFIIAMFFVHGYIIISIIKSIFIIITLLMIIKIIRWLTIFITNRVSILYMILYLCTLELVPLLTLYKVIA